MSTVSSDTSRETATPVTDGCNNNRMVHSTNSSRVGKHPHPHTHTHTDATDNNTTFVTLSLRGY